MKDIQISLLNKAKERLFTKGWVKHSGGTYNSPNCLLGAVYHSRPANYTGYLPGTTVTCSELIISTYDILDDLALEQGFGDVPSFNDDATTTFDDVLELIDTAIKRLESE